MPSSTSNSKIRAPLGPWPLVWGTAGLVTFSAILGAEWGCRELGYTPSVSENADLWASQRGTVYPRFPGEKVIVLLGGSRMQLDVDPGVMSEELGRHRVVQLSIDASNALPVLEDLAADTAFSGIVIASLISSHFYSDPGRSAEYVAHYHELDRNLNFRINQAAEVWLQSNSVIRNSYLSLRTLLTRLLTEGSFPAPSHVRMFSDRTVKADYRLVDIVEHRESRVVRDSLVLQGIMGRGLPAGTFLEGLRSLEEAVRRIQIRGGAVALVRLPTGDRLWANRNAVFPREEYWDVLAAETSAFTLHFKDVQELQGFQPPDESHLDYRDAAAFTRALVGALKARGFPPPM